jgi:hypothetical protein
MVLKRYILFIVVSLASLDTWAAFCYCSNGQAGYAQSCDACLCPPTTTLVSCSPLANGPAGSPVGPGRPCTAANGCKQIGGDCQGNNWCDNRLLVNPSPALVRLGEAVTLYSEEFNLGSLDPQRRTLINSPGSPVTQFKWGDEKVSSQRAIGRISGTHTYARAAKYSVQVTQFGQFKWNDPAGRGSCSYECTATKSVEVLVESPVKASMAKSATVKSK